MILLFRLRNLPAGRRRGTPGHDPFDIRQRGILHDGIGFVDIGFSDLASARVWVEPEQYKVVGACLAAARRGLGINQQELARRLGKPQSFVSEYERGQRRVDVVELLMIARALGIEPLGLFAEATRSV